MVRFSFHLAMSCLLSLREKERKKKNLQSFDFASEPTPHEHIVCVYIIIIIFFREFNGRADHALVF